MKPIHGLTDAARRAGMRKGGYIPIGMIRWRIGQLHVSTSALAIAREFWHQRARKLPRSIKRAIVRTAIREHQANRALYAFVIRGR